MTMINALQDECFKMAQAAAHEQNDDYRGVYAAYIGELESMLLTIARRDRVAECEIEEMLRCTLVRFRRMKERKSLMEA